MRWSHVDRRARKYVAQQSVSDRGMHKDAPNPHATRPLPFVVRRVGNKNITIYLKMPTWRNR